MTPTYGVLDSNDETLTIHALAVSSYVVHHLRPIPRFLGTLDPGSIARRDDQDRSGSGLNL